MNADLLDDLKQFIDSRLSQTEARFDNKLDVLKDELDELRTEMRDGFAGVADTMETMYGDIDQRLTALVICSASFP